MGEKVTSTVAGSERKISGNEKVIRFEGQNTDLLWRICGDNLNPDVQISVPLTHDVIIIKDGTSMNVYRGGLHKIFTEVKKGFLGFGRKTDATTVDVIFVNKTIKVQVDWGTKTPVLMRDPLTDIPVHVRGNGVFEFGVYDTEKFYTNFVGMDRHFSVESLKARLLERIMGNFVNIVSSTLREQRLSYVDLQMSQAYLNRAFPEMMNAEFIEDYGIKMYSFTISAIGLSEDEERKVEGEINRRKQEMKDKQTADEIVAELERLEDRHNARADERDEIAWKRALTLKTLEQADYNKYVEVQKILAGRRSDTTVVVNGAAVTATEKVTPAAFCSKCGKAVDSGEIFCKHCGAKLGKTCPGCLTKLGPNDVYCPKCGTKCK